MRRCSTQTVIMQIVTVLLMVTAITPLRAVAVSAQSADGLTGDQQYESPQFGYEVTWDDPWLVDERATRSRDERDDRLVLVNEENDAELTIRGVFTEDSPETVVDDAVANLQDDEDEVSVEDERRRAGQASTLLSYSSGGGKAYEYVEVTALDDGASVLLVDLVASSGDFGATVDALGVVEIDRNEVFRDEPEVPDEARGADPTETPADEGTVRRRPNLGSGSPTEEATEAADDGADGVDGNTFTSPNFDFSLSWDVDVWDVEETSIDEADGDQISLNTRDSFLIVQASTDFSGDVDDCVSTITDFLSDGSDEVEIDDVEVLDDEDGDPIEGSSRSRAYVANLYTAALDGDEGEFVYYVECRTLVEDESELVIFHFVADPDDYTDEAEAREEIVDTLETRAGSGGGDDPTPTADDDEPTSTPEEDEDETPEAGDETTFESDAFGFSLSYDPGLWEETGSGDDGIALDDGPSSLTIAAAEEYDGDAVACVQGQSEDIRGFDGITRVDPETGDNGRRISGGDGERFFALYRVTASDGTFDGTNELLAYLECRTLEEGSSVISILHLIFDPDQYEREASRAEAVLETIEVGG